MKIPGFPGDRDKKSTSTGRKSYFLIPPLALWHPWWHQFMDWMVIFLTVMLCLLMLPTRLPGMELLGIGPNWLLIWVVAWSVNRSVFSGLLSGIILGLLQDAMTSPDPTHALSLGIVGMLTALMQKQRFIQEDFISIALIVFAMAVVADTIFAFQLSWAGNRHGASIWTYYQRATLASAILSSLWAPVVYYPLNRWWQQMKLIRNS
ncbi:MAG: rod shape-determining protein MreD [Dolichospermum sp. LBC05a]|jgi:rod shape-determining protein MreD|nr:rod shape-determining protein MreD [Dolichospermum sp. DEX182a]MBS9392633.1 rod shape-determining protein MreD [Dolichospermum sp. OL01]MCO5796272.1 rod shape-determining protein MreD [Dolichospermum sp. OL03]MCS6282268.1 rod shape-determining protein MreD [Dolichospermum sp.]QSV57893.1 MAG: rod shape-determining protein MreD [Dolichospermum sp. LBC05a]